MNAGAAQGGERLRLFFALWPTERVRAKLAGWASAIHPLSGGRMMQPGNLHITLAFLGTVDAARLDTLRAVAARVGVNPCTLWVDQPGYWKHNRIVWAGATAVPAELAALVADLRAALAAAAFAFDVKAFVAHATLIRRARPVEPLPRLHAIEWPVRDFALVRSVAVDEGVRYEVVAEWPEHRPRRA